MSLLQKLQCFASDVTVEFDPVVYGPTTEGPQSSVSFRVVARAPPAREITVLFSTRSLSATGKYLKYSHVNNSISD